MKKLLLLPRVSRSPPVARRRPQAPPAETTGEMAPAATPDTGMGGCRTTARHVADSTDGPGHAPRVSAWSARSTPGPGYRPGPAVVFRRRARRPANGSATTVASPAARHRPRSPGSTSRRIIARPSAVVQRRASSAPCRPPCSPGSTAAPPSGRLRLAASAESAQLPIGVAAEVEAGDGLLSGIAALGVRDPADLVVAHFLRQGPLVDLGAQCGPAGEDPGGVEVALVTANARRPRRAGAVSAPCAGSRPDQAAPRTAPSRREGHRDRAHLAAHRGTRPAPPGAPMPDLARR